MNNGRDCDNCGCGLSEEDYDRYGSWSYNCPGCGFHYIHSSSLTTDEQVVKFNGQDEEDEE